MRWFQQGMAVFLSWCLVFVGLQDASAYQAGAPAPQSPPMAMQQGPEQLEQLVAPIALYPDSLIAQLLAASTYPNQIVEAEQWMEKHKDLKGDKLGKEVDKQNWDPSVKALTQFPEVLANMNQNLAWTSELGDAYVNQAQQVNQAVQTMRQRAKEAGNLKTTPQEKVSTQGNTIVIQPAAPEVVYVPQYDPWLVYGAPMAAFPGWYGWPGLYLGGPGIAFGLGFGVGLFAGFGWGWHHWGYDWHGGRGAEFNHNRFVSHSTTIINRNNFHGGGGFHGNSFHGGGGGFHGNAFHGGEGGFHGSNGMHSGAFSGFNHGGVARDSGSRGRSSFSGGGFHGGGGFHAGGGGFHGGGGHGGGGHR